MVVLSRGFKRELGYNTNPTRTTTTTTTIIIIIIIIISTTTIATTTTTRPTPPPPMGITIGRERLFRFQINNQPCDRASPHARKCFHSWGLLIDEPPCYLTLLPLPPSSAPLYKTAAKSLQAKASCVYFSIIGHSSSTMSIIFFFFYGLFYIPWPTSKIR